jgi:crotonobetainyl-CoA:carnitine CoA-transferase CaiB-like acyl-CoA transferase
MTTYSRSGPLAGYRVLELGSTVAGPFCGRLFSDFGAEVIKIELPAGDPVRSMGRQDGDASLYAASILRNKALVALDLHRKEGQEIVRELAARSDVVIENFRPGTLEKWGLGYDALRAANPRLVMVRISGYGQSGPYSGRPGYGVIGEAVSGLRGLTGDPDRPPARINTSLSDYVTGLYAALGAVMALNHCERTGEGQMVDAALYECAFSFLEPHVPAFARLGEIAQRSGSALPGSAPNNLYEAADGGHVHITAISNPIFQRLCESMGQPQLARDPRFQGARIRAANAQALDEEVQAWVGSLSADEVERVLNLADVPAAKIYTVADIFSDPHYRSRNMLVQVASRELGTVTVPNVVPRLSGTPGEIRHAGGPIGADTREVLSRFLGMSDERIEALEKAHVVFAAP